MQPFNLRHRFIGLMLSQKRRHAKSKSPPNNNSNSLVHMAQCNPRTRAANARWHSPRDTAGPHKLVARLRPMLRRVILPQLLIATALSLLSSAPIPAQFKLGIDSQAQDRTPKGPVLEKVWKSQVITGTIRRYWVYVPAQYNSKHKTAVMVFQDGHT